MNRKELMPTIFLALNVIIALTILVCPPPATIGRIHGPQNAAEDRYIPMCNGIRCLFCGNRCFLPEGRIGMCKFRVNFGNKKYLLK